jgi:hypothetical protein
LKLCNTALFGIETIRFNDIYEVEYYNFQHNSKTALI